MMELLRVHHFLSLERISITIGLQISMTESETVQKPTDFIRNIIADDLEANMK